MTTIDDFAKLDIRLGKVVVAEILEDTDKLVRLEVDFGDETRQIISGIQSRIESAEELVGQMFPFITNLEPRTIRGLESNGMILVPHDGGFLTPTTEVAPGTKIG